jgi:amino acid permease
MGGKTIPFWGGVALFINNITGGGMVLFPQLYQEAGWLLSTGCLLLIMGLSCACTLMVIAAMSIIPGNGRFQKRIEYTTIMQHYLPRSGYWIAMMLYQLSLACNNSKKHTGCTTDTQFYLLIFQTILVHLTFYLLL